MKGIINANAVAVESYALVNKSSLLNLAKIVELCLIKSININLNKKTEIKPNA